MKVIIRKKKLTERTVMKALGISPSRVERIGNDEIIITVDESKVKHDKNILKTKAKDLRDLFISEQYEIEVVD